MPYNTSRDSAQESDLILNEVLLQRYAASYGRDARILAVPARTAEKPAAALRLIA